MHFWVHIFAPQVEILPKKYEKLLTHPKLSVYLVIMCLLYRITCSKANYNVFQLSYFARFYTL